MRLGIPTEIKNHEYRVGMMPAAVHEAVTHGHEVFVQSGAGKGMGCSDGDYEKAGAKITATAKEIFADSDMIVKVKEPRPAECRMLGRDQLLFAYLHLAADPVQADLLAQSGCTAIAYETITDDHGHLPLLSPMSEIAGRMSVQAGAVALQRNNGGSGILPGGVPGTDVARVVVLGGGVVGTNAARMAMGLGADVVVLDKSLPRLRQLEEAFGPNLKTRFATLEATKELSCRADLLIGAVLVPGSDTPKLVSRAMLDEMKAGTVLVDVAIDQGGCFETSRPTTHDDPTFIVNDIVHYCVTNMPGVVARTSTVALNNATLPFILALADKGWKRAVSEDRHLRHGVNIHDGHVTNKAVATALGKDFSPLSELL